MPANSFNRETARDAFATLLLTAMVGAPAVAQAVYNYKVKKLNGQSPVVTVDGGPIAREKVKFAGQWDTAITLYVTAFVLWADPASGWTEANCEDRLDLIEKTLADVVLDHMSQAQDATVPWDKIEFDGASVPDVHIESGVVYWTETFAVKARKVNG